MDQFSYLSVLLSIIVGLAITQVLKGFRGIVLARTRIVSYWPVLLWAIWLLFGNVQSWWAMFDLRDVENWTFAAFAVVLSQTIIQYMLAAIVFPDFFGEEEVDLRAHYWSHTRWFFGLLILLLIASLSKDLVLAGHLTEPVNLGFHVCFMAFAVSGLIFKQEWYHKFLAVLAPASLLAYVVVLFSRLH